MELNWTASTDTNVTGYDLTRDGLVLSPVPGRATSAYTDSTTGPAGAYTYALTSTVESWRSAPRTAAVTAC